MAHIRTDRDSLGSIRSSESTSSMISTWDLPRRLCCCKSYERSTIEERSMVSKRRPIRHSSWSTVTIHFIFRVCNWHQRRSLTRSWWWLCRFQRRKGRGAIQEFDVSRQELFLACILCPNTPQLTHCFLEVNRLIRSSVARGEARVGGTIATAIMTEFAPSSEKELKQNR